MVFSEPGGIDQAVLKVVERSVSRGALGDTCWCRFDFDRLPIKPLAGLGKLGKGPPQKLRPDLLRTLTEEPFA